MKSTTLLISVFIIGTLISSCSNLNYRINKTFNKDLRKVEGSKNVIEFEVLTADFNTIDFGNQSYKVSIVQDTVCKIIVHGEDNVVLEYQPTVENGVLSIVMQPNTAIYAHEEITFTVHIKELNAINSDGGRYESLGILVMDTLKINGKGIYSLTLDAQYLDANLEGGRPTNSVTKAACGAWLEAKGNVVQSKVMINNNATFDAPELTGQDMQIDYTEDGYYIIKLKNFETTNVLLPRNKVKVGYKTVLG